MEWRAGRGWCVVRIMRCQCGRGEGLGMGKRMRLCGRQLNGGVDMGCVIAVFVH